MIPDLPPSFQQLYQESGAILRFRILRDVLGRDESWIETAQAQAAVLKHPRVQDLAERQLENGSYENLLAPTVAATLWLCEAGVEEHPAVQTTLELVILPTLAEEHETWELGTSRRALVRDVCLHVLARATRGRHEVLESYLELVKYEWQLWSADRKAAPPPTVPAYSALAWWQPSPDRVLAKRELLARTLREVEQQPEVLLPDASRLIIPDKQSYLAEPVRLLHDLELGARAGIVAEVEHLRWLYDELEVQQDADGLWRFQFKESPPYYSWYYPLEEDAQDRELTVRALIIYKLLNYDV